MRRTLSHLLILALAVPAAALAAVPLPAAAQATAPKGNTALLFTIVTAQCGPAPLNTYPRAWCTAPMGTYRLPLGYSSRYCGSYAAWMELSTGHRVPPFHVLGRPGYWPQRVPASWITARPHAGEAAVVPSNPGLPGGHALYILDPDWLGTGDLLVSYYNGAPVAGQGLFTEAVWAPSGMVNGYPFHLVYIQFPPAGGAVAERA